MMSKALAIALLLAIPGFVSYPVSLDVDVRHRKSPAAVTVDIWPLPPTATTVVSPQARRPIVETHTAGPQYLGGEFLARELQRQLRRVGCYTGDINGAWTRSTQRAMKTYLTRVNATLPTALPDQFLLAVVQNAPDKACNMPCAPDESPASDGRCVPGAIAGLAGKAAASARQSRPLIMRWSTTLPTDADGVPVYTIAPPPLVAPAPPQAAPKRVALPAPASPKLPRVVTQPTPPRHAATPAPRSAPQRPVVASANRETSRGSHSSESVRSLFQRLDDSSR